MAGWQGGCERWMADEMARSGSSRSSGRSWSLRDRSLGGGPGSCRMACAAIAAVILVLGCSSEAPEAGFDPEVATELEAVVEAAVDDAAAGVVVGVDGLNGRWRTGAGPNDLDEAAELSGDEAFRIGSITKMFTAVVVLQLTEEDAVDLDAPVAEVVAERAQLFEHGDEVTLRQLLSHTSGLPDPGVRLDLVDDLQIEDDEARLTCEDARASDFLEFAADDPPSFEPGAGWAYSNTGFLLVGKVIEAVTDQDLHEVYRERILDPLEMDDTWLACAEEPRSEQAQGHYPPGSVPPLDQLEIEHDRVYDVTEVFSDAGAAGGLISTAADVMVFSRELFAGRLFAETTTLETMLEPPTRAQYGLGAVVDGDIVGHDGSMVGYHSRLTYDREQDLTIVALSNQNATARSNLAETVTTALRRRIADIDHPD